MIYLNGVEIIPTIFPDKTSQVWKVDEYLIKKYEQNIKWVFESEGEFLHIAQLVDLLKIYRAGEINLEIPYFPYARQDKIVSNCTTFAKSTFLKLLEGLKINSITCFDIHSDYLNNEYRIKSVSPLGEVIQSAVNCGAELLVYPDKGALNKYAKDFNKIFDYIYAEKIRNQENGQIVEIKYFGSCKDKVCLIVDDICDGGRTFIELSSLLYSGGAKEVNLYVSHGIFSNGIKILKDAGIKKIFTKEGLKNDTSN